DSSWSSDCQRSPLCSGSRSFAHLEPESMLHSDTVVVVGPLPPLVPRAFRFRLRAAASAAVAAGLCLAMFAASVLALEPNSMRGCGLAALGKVLASVIPDARSDTGTIPVLFVSRPADATTLLDDRELGHTPTQILVAPGAVLRLRLDGFLDDFVRVNAP